MGGTVAEGISQDLILGELRLVREDRVLVRSLRGDSIAFSGSSPAGGLAVSVACAGPVIFPTDLAHSPTAA